MHGVRRAVLTATLSLALIPLAQAEIITETLTYTVDGQEYTGHLAYDDGVVGKRPGVLVVHEWWGLNEHARNKAEDLAKLGYTALALDMYGTGKRASHPEDAKKFMQAVMGNMDAAEQRFRAAMELLQDQPTVDPERIAAQGYCFGGAVVLHMARRGVDLDGVVSFHGNLSTQIPAAPGTVKARVQVYTGGADPFVPTKQVTDFVAEMQDAGVDLMMRSYAGVKHSFTNPGADAKGEEFGLPLEYDAHADQDSWDGMQAFYREIFSAPRM